MRSRAFASTVFLAITAIAPSAAADAIMPITCPPGLDVRGHHTRDCWPRACTADAPCGDGAACRQVSRCIRTRDIHEGDSMETTPRDYDDGPCAAGRACSEGATCRQLSRCEPTEATASFVNGRWTSEDYVPPARGMCAAGGRSAPSAWALVSVAAILVGRLRRSRLRAEHAA